MGTVISGNNSTTDGLIFGYDTGNTQRSWKGEPTTNLMTNPDFSDGTSSPWNFQQVEYGARYVSEDFFDERGYCIKLERTGNTGECNTWYNAGAGLSLKPSTVYSYSADVLCEVPGTARLFTYLAGVNGSSSYHSGSGKWERLEMQFTTDASGNVQTRFSLQDTSKLTTAYFDNIQIEEKEYATNFTTSSRSTTESLYDFGGNQSLDVSNMRFSANGIKFEGTQDINLGGEAFNMGLGDMTFELCFSVSSGSEWIATKTYAGAGFYRYGMAVNNNKLRFLFSWDSGSHVDYYGTDILSIDTMYHATFVINRSSGIDFYLNGEYDISRDISSKSSIDMTSTWPFRIGGYTGGDQVSLSNGFSGELPMFKIYDRALSAQEVKRNFNSIKTRFGI